MDPHKGPHDFGENPQDIARALRPRTARNEQHHQAPLDWTLGESGDEIDQACDAVSGSDGDEYVNQDREGTDTDEYGWEDEEEEEEEETEEETDADECEEDYDDDEFHLRIKQSKKHSRDGRAQLSTSSSPKSEGVPAASAHTQPARLDVPVPFSARPPEKDCELEPTFWVSHCFEDFFAGLSDTEEKSLIDKAQRSGLTADKLTIECAVAHKALVSMGLLPGDRIYHELLGRIAFYLHKKNRHKFVLNMDISYKIARTQEGKTGLFCWGPAMIPTKYVDIDMIMTTYIAQMIARLRYIGLQQAAAQTKANAITRPVSPGEPKMAAAPTLTPSVAPLPASVSALQVSSVRPPAPVKRRFNFTTTSTQNTATSQAPPAKSPLPSATVSVLAKSATQVEDRLILHQPPTPSPSQPSTPSAESDLGHTSEADGTVIHVELDYDRPYKKQRLER